MNADYCKANPDAAARIIRSLKQENDELRAALSKAKACLKLEGYKATSTFIVEIDALLRK